jgi:hypothetical protein
MRKQKTTHQLRRATGLNRLGGANSLGSKKLADDTSSKSAAHQDKELASLEPNAMTLAPGGSRHHADQDRATYAHGSSHSRKSEDGLIEGTIGEALKSREFKGRITR